MDHPGLTPDDAERLLRGAPPDAVDDALRPLAEVLAAARRPLPSPDARRTADAVAAMVAAVHAGGGPAVALAGRPRRRLRVPVTAAAMAGVLSLFGGLAAAGALPAPAQHTVANVLSKAGIAVPRGTDRPHLRSPGGQSPPASSPHPGPSSAGDATAHSAPVPTTIGPVVPSSVAPSAGPVAPGPASTTTTSTTEPPEANEPPDEAPAPAKGTPPGEAHRPPDQGSENDHSNRGGNGGGR